MTCMFVCEKMMDPYIVAIDSLFTESQRTCLAQIMYEQRYGPRLDTY